MLIKKKIYSVVVLLIVVVVLGVTNKRIDNNAKGQVKKLKSGKVAVDKLNVRAGVGLNYEVVGNVFKGEVVVIEGEISYPGVPAWLKIKAPKNVKLYVSKQFVDKLSGNRGIVKENNVNIRASASVKSTIVNQLNKGEQVIITGKKDDFYEIKPPRGTSLFVAKTYVDIIGDYVAGRDLSKSRLVLSEMEWQNRFRSVTLRATEEHKKDISIKDYNAYIMELRELHKMAPNDRLKSKASERIAALQGFQALVDSIRGKDSDVKKKLLEDIVARGDRPSEKIPTFVNPHPVQEEFTYKASGYLEGVGLYFGRPAPYKLLNNKQVVCFVRSEKSLKKYLGKFVEVRGRNYQDGKGRNILELSDIKILDDTF